MEDDVFDSSDQFFFNGTENYYDDYMPYSKRPETYIVPVVFGLIFIVSDTFLNSYYLFAT